jgi:hypothetical protein
MSLATNALAKVKVLGTDRLNTFRIIEPLYGKFDMYTLKVLSYSIRSRKPSHLRNRLKV